MAKAGPATIKIRWIRSGIAFNRKQSEVIRSLGLRRLQHVVERPDTPVVRGLIAKVAHLVEVVDAESRPARPSVPEYTIIPREDVPAVETSESGRKSFGGTEPAVASDTPETAAAEFESSIKFPSSL